MKVNFERWNTVCKKDDLHSKLRALTYSNVEFDEECQRSNKTSGEDSWNSKEFVVINIKEDRSVKTIQTVSGDSRDDGEIMSDYEEFDNAREERSEEDEITGSV
uniref:Uncharacterized protein n=1 Tax=Megaselia scalaris TaxID=36166 RepID=T1GL80_MEGSC